jgi:hypothetical protein
MERRMISNADTQGADGRRVLLVGKKTSELELKGSALGGGYLRRM